LAIAVAGCCSTTCRRARSSAWRASTRRWGCSCGRATRSWRLGCGCGAGARGAVSHACACIGSLCLRNCVHGAPIGPADHPLIACPDDAAFNPPSFLTRPTPNTDAAPWAPSHCTVPKLSTEVSILIESAPHWPAGRPLRWPPSAPRLGRRSWGSAPTKSTHVSCFSGQKGPNWAMHGHAQAGWLADRSTEIL
jgi:hypothetical protein